MADSYDRTPEGLLQRVLDELAEMRSRPTGAPLTGVGSPEGVVTARGGTLYVRLDGVAGSILYAKVSDEISSTGWSAV